MVIFMCNKRGYISLAVLGLLRFMGHLSLIGQGVPNSNSMP